MTELNSLFNKSKGWEGTADELIVADFKPISYIVDELIPEESIIYVYGDPESCKSMYMLQCCMCCSKGINLLNRTVKKCKTLYIDEENRERRMGMRTKAMSKALGLTTEDLKNFKLTISKEFKICNSEWCNWLKRQLAEFKPELVVIDGLSKVFLGNVKEDKDVNTIHRNLAPLIRDYHCSFVIIHHTTKSNYLDFGKRSSIKMDDMYGNRQLSAMADTMLVFDKLNKKTDIGNNLYLLKQAKNKDMDQVGADNFYLMTKYHESEDFDLDSKPILDEIELVWEGDVSDKYKDATDRCKLAIIKWMTDTKIKGFKRETCVNVMKGEGFSSSIVDKALNIIKTKGELSYVYGKYGEK